MMMLQKKETVESFEDLLTLAEVCEEHKFSDIQIVADASSQVDYLPTAVDNEAQTMNTFTSNFHKFSEMHILPAVSSQMDYLPMAVNKEAQTVNNFTFSIRVIIEDESKLKYLLYRCH